MSPEVMQKWAYDSKSDVWSLGCLIYELCALKPPFHRAKTLVELDMCIRYVFVLHPITPIDVSGTEMVGYPRYRKATLMPYQT